MGERLARERLDDAVARTVEAARWLRDATAAVDPGVAWTYRPLDYAWDLHRAYLERYGGRKRALLVGMNPGPWGMGQTGIPFGDPPTVRDWLGLHGPVQVPPGLPLHPKRPVEGFASKRTEPSGRRLWGLLRERYGTAERALRDLLVVNYCPLLLFNEDGQNVTPDKLPAGPRRAVHEACDEGLRRMVAATGAEVLIGVGRYAETRCGDVTGGAVRVLCIPHPSPASPAANRNGGADWKAAVEAGLDAAGL